MLLILFFNNIYMDDTPDIEIIENKILGKGAYGTVYLGLKTIKEPKTKNIEIKTELEGSKNKNAESKIKNSESKSEVVESTAKIDAPKIKIALKEIPPEIENDQDAKNSLSNEIVVSSYLDNTNIVRMMDIVYKKNKRYLAYEYCNGGDLRNYINYFERFDEELIQIIVIKMVNALLELHKKGVVHHDIKPENILIQLYPGREETKEHEAEIDKIKEKIRLKKVKNDHHYKTTEYYNPNKLDNQNNNHQKMMDPKNRNNNYQDIINNYNYNNSQGAPNNNNFNPFFQNNNNNFNPCFQNNYNNFNQCFQNNNNQQMIDPKNRNNNYQYIINNYNYNNSQGAPNNNNFNPFFQNNNNNFNPCFQNNNNNFNQCFQNNNNQSFKNYNNNNNFNQFFQNNNNFNLINIQYNNNNNNFMNINPNQFNKCLNNNINNMNNFNNNKNNFPMSNINNNLDNIYKNHNGYNSNNQINNNINSQLNNNNSQNNKNNENKIIEDKYILNVLKKAQFKLSDFGLSKIKTEINEKNLCGSPLYMAPELLSKDCTIIKIEDPKVDIWALGVMAYEMFFGKRPFQAPSIPTLINAYKKGEYNIDLNDIKENKVSKELFEFIILCLQGDPKKRASVEDLRNSSFYNMSYKTLEKMDIIELKEYLGYKKNKENILVLSINKEYLKDRNEN